MNHIEGGVPQDAFSNCNQICQIKTYFLSLFFFFFQKIKSIMIEYKLRRGLIFVLASDIFKGNIFEKLDFYC